VRSSSNPTICRLPDSIRHQLPAIALAFALGKTKGFSEELLQALPVAVYTTDAQGRITSFNEAAVRLWGCRPEIGAVNIVVDISERKRAEEVYAFTDRLYRARGLKEIYEAALDAITRGLGCSRAAILLFDTAGVMRFVAWRGLSDSYRSAVEGHSPWTRDVKDPVPICIADVETADPPEPLKAVVKAERIAALAFFPVVANGALIGKFMTYHDAAHVLREADINLALTIARHWASAWNACVQSRAVSCWRQSLPILTTRS
jgi:transcriptional regulator with GAF, ATPase, and Fis domain